MKGVPVVDVTSENFREVWPSLVLAVKSATFVALDTELSGLGDRKSLNAKCVEERYKAVSHIANTRAIVSLGISTYKLLPSPQTSGIGEGDSSTKAGDTSTKTGDSTKAGDSRTKAGDMSSKAEDSNTTAGDKSSKAGDSSTKAGDSRTKADVTHSVSTMTYMVQTFNISVLCQQDYVVESDSLRFLVDHGFDFNKQYSQGIPYAKGDDQTNLRLEKPGIRALFSQIILSQVPVVFHNAFVDLGFLYGNLYTSLPPSLGSFLSDISEMFAAGIYDTKYISEFVAHFPASYLDYIFHKSLRENETDTEDGHPKVTLTFPKYPASQSSVTYRTCSVPDPSRPLPHPEILKVMRGLLCENFAAHGWCPKRRECTKSHDIDLILDSEDVTTKKKRRPRKRKRRGGCEKGSQNEAVQNEGEQNAGEQCDADTGESPMSVDGLTSWVSEDSAPCKLQKQSLDGANASSECVSDDKCSVGDRNNTDQLGENVANGSSPTGNHLPNAEQSTSQGHDTNSNKGHRAGFDAFMTGFAMATFVARYGKVPSKVAETKASLSDWSLEDLVNKVCLSGKSIPLIITKSSYCKTSKQHSEKLERLRSLAS